jgi:hypothetical protein
LKSKKTDAEFEQQIASMNNKNKTMQIQLSKKVKESPRVSSPTTETANPVDESKIDQPLIEFPVQCQLPPLGHRELTQSLFFGLFELLFNNPSSFAPLDDFYPHRFKLQQES